MEKHGFNHEKAMNTAHQDEAIVLKLRQMFIQDMTGQLAQAKALWQNKDINALQSHLHQILGGAQVCAADSLVACISQFKEALKETPATDELQNMWQEVVKTCEIYEKY